MYRKKKNKFTIYDEKEAKLDRESTFRKQKIIMVFSFVFVIVFIYLFSNYPASNVEPPLSDSKLADEALLNNYPASNVEPLPNSKLADEALQTLDRLVSKLPINNPCSNSTNKFNNKFKVCNPNVIRIGAGWGSHFIGKNIPDNCTFQSWGISHDYSFDEDLVTNHGCRGELFDPTTSYRSDFLPRSTFYKLGHPLLGVTNAPWGETDPIEMFEKSGWKTLDVLKMDCEGCEYYLATALEKRPDFFDLVTTFTIEFHAPKTWAKTPQHVENLGMLVHHVLKSGLTLVHTDEGECWDTRITKTLPSHFIPEMYKYSFGRDFHCRSFTFTRIPKYL